MRKFRTRHTLPLLAAKLCVATFLGYGSLLPLPAYAAVFYPTTYTLDNGLELVVVPNHLAPAVTQMVWYKVGASDEIAPRTGLAHYLEHLMFRGTADVGPGDFSKTIAAQGGNDNAFTSYDYTAFHETVAVDRLPLIMKMEADRMHNLRILPATATPELSVVLNERQERTDNSPEGRFDEKLRKALMPAYPYGTPVIGWKPQIEKLTADDATAFYHAHYAPNNAIVVISGDVAPEQVLDLAKSTFGALPRADIKPRKAFPKLQKPSQTQLNVTDIGVEQAQLETDTVVPSYSTQKSTEAYAFEVLSEILDSGEVGVLYKDLTTKQHIASGIGTNYDPDARGDALFTIEASPSPGQKPEDLESALKTELNNLARQGFDDKTVDDAKNRLQRDAIFARDSLLGPGYAFGMAMTTGHGVKDVEEWPDRIKAVTTADVNAALNQLVGSKNTIAGLLLPDPHATQAAREAARPAINHDMSIR